MRRTITLLLLFSCSPSNNCWADNVSTSGINGFGSELILTKLDYLEYKFLELQVEVKEQGEMLLHNQDKGKQAILEQTGDILEQQKIFSNHEEIKNSIFELRPRKHPSDNSKLLTFLTEQSIVLAPLNKHPISSCLEEQSKTSGRYWLSLANNSSFEVYCEQTLYGGGWIVIQSRFDGSVDFYRNWTDYKIGFGDLDGEFWLGLDNIHLITSSKPKELLVHLEDFNGNVKYARYDKFAIGSEIEKYVLTTLDGFNGTLSRSSSLEYNKAQKFSTLDADNDPMSIDCAKYHKSSWWFNKCTYCNLNGMYINKEDKESMFWSSFTGKQQGLKISKMMVR